MVTGKLFLPLVFWSRIPTKFFVFLWCLRWGLIYSFMKLQQWGINAPSKCLLCDNEGETMIHHFLNYQYSKRLLLQYCRPQNGLIIHYRETPICQEQTPIWTLYWVVSHKSLKDSLKH